MNAMKGQFSMGALKPPCHKKPVGQKVTGEGKLPTVAGEKRICEAKINQNCIYQKNQLNQKDGAEVL